MVRLRLRRVGAKKQPSYRLVAADAEMPRDGRFLEVMGHYNPRTDPQPSNLKKTAFMTGSAKAHSPANLS